MAAPKVPKKRVPKLKRIWKCNQVPDFLYGHRVGYYKGLAEGMILERYRRQLSTEEDNEVFETVQPYIEVLRKYLRITKIHADAQKIKLISHPSVTMKDIRLVYVL